MSEKEYCQDSKFNRHLLSITDNYSALLKVQVQEKIRKMKEGARNIANRSNNPELLKICRELDKIEIK